MELETFADIAQLLGQRNDAARYRGLANQARNVWNANFFNPASHTYVKVRVSLPPYFFFFLVDTPLTSLISGLSNRSSLATSFGRGTL